MRICVAMATCGLFVLMGCSGGAFNQVGEAGSQASGGTAGARLTGVVHGGQQPIVGAHVYLFAAASGASGAGQAAYGGAGIAASTSNASVSLLTSGTLDSSGGATNGDYYVTTDSNGNFSISSDYSCAAGQQVYLYSLGGNPGAGTNSAAGLMAALGNCPAAGNFATATPFVFMNEVSTVAAAYAMAGFATDAEHVGSSGTALALTGIKNAFANAANLETLATGAALAATPAGNGTVPQAEINTLANILASCVNSNGAVTGPTNATACYTLFTNALSAGGTGTQPADTATAAINIAHNPGVGVAALYGLGTANPPFAGGLTSAPSNGWMVALTFSGGGLEQSTARVQDAVYRPGTQTDTLIPGIAIDGQGNVWTTSPLNNSIVEISSGGAFLSGTAGYSSGGLNGPGSIAIDPFGNAWVTNYTGNSVSEFSSSGLPISGAGGYRAGGIAAPISIAVDGVGDAWIANEGGTVTELSTSGSALSGTNGFAVGFADLPLDGGNNEIIPETLAIDGSNNVWIAASGNSVVFEINSSGASLSGSTGFHGSGLADPFGVAIDGAGDAWIADASPYSASELTSSGSISQYSPFAGTVGESGVAIDGSGTPWFTNGCVIHDSTFGYRYASYCPAMEESSDTQIAIDGSGSVWLANGEIPSSVYPNVIEIIGAATPVVTPLSVGVKNNALGARP